MKVSPYKVAIRKAYKKGYNAAYSKRLKNPASMMAEHAHKPTKQQLEIERATREGISIGMERQRKADADGVAAAKMQQEKNEARIKAINSVAQLAQSVSHIVEGAYRLVQEIHN